MDTVEPLARGGQLGTTKYADITMEVMVLRGKIVEDKEHLLLIIIGGVV